MLNYFSYYIIRSTENLSLNVVVVLYIVFAFYEVEYFIFLFY